MEMRVRLRHYDAVVPSNIDIPNIMLHDTRDQAANDYPDRPCTILKGAVITYSQMSELTDRLAAGLADRGVKKGDRATIFMPKSPQFVIGSYAILKAGGMPVATNPMRRAPLWGPLYFIPILGRTRHSLGSGCHRSSGRQVQRIAPRIFLDREFPLR